MEEVDHIIIHTLKQIGCDLEEDVGSLLQFTTENVVDGVVRCLKLIEPEINGDLPQHVPGNMVARYRVGTAIAAACTAAGYVGEIGYQTFLYSSETELRKIFMFLIEKLPKENEKEINEPLGSSVLAERAIAAELSKHLSNPWLPPFCKERGIRFTTPNCWHWENPSGSSTFNACPLFIPSYGENLGTNLTKETKFYYEKIMKESVQQVTSNQFIPSLLAANSQALALENEKENELNQMALESRHSHLEILQRQRMKIKKRVSQALIQSLQNTEDQGNIRSSSPIKVLKNKGSRFIHAEKLQFKEEQVEVTQLASEEKVKKREAEIAELQTQAEKLSLELSNIELQMKQMTGGLQQMSEQLQIQEQKSRELQETMAVRKQTLDLLPDGDSNLKKLQNVVELTGQR